MPATGSRSGRSRDDRSRDASGGVVAEKQHPLPWRNTPTGGENNVTDARGATVYRGCDASEMFLLLAAATAPADSTQRHPRALQRVFSRRTPRPHDPPPKPTV